MTTNKTDRKERPMYRGLLKYFPDALAEVSHVSFVGNQQHNPGEELHWAKHKSTDHADCVVRHLVEAGTVDADGLRHTAKLAWRALALLQTELDLQDDDEEDVALLQTELDLQDDDEEDDNEEKNYDGFYTRSGRTPREWGWFHVVGNTAEHYANDGCVFVRRCNNPSISYEKEGIDAGRYVKLDYDPGASLAKEKSCE